MDLCYVVLGVSACQTLKAKPCCLQMTSIAIFSAPEPSLELVSVSPPSKIPSVSLPSKCPLKGIC